VRLLVKVREKERESGREIKRMTETERSWTSRREQKKYPQKKNRNFHVMIGRVYAPRKLYWIPRVIHGQINLNE
jgi:hypothetical protein